MLFAGRLFKVKLQHINSIFLKIQYLLKILKSFKYKNADMKYKDPEEMLASKTQKTRIRK